jgi:hypothetical protein
MGDYGSEVGVGKAAHEYRATRPLRASLAPLDSRLPVRPSSECSSRCNRFLVRKVAARTGAGTSCRSGLATCI